jgi:VanZ family protein
MNHIILIRRLGMLACLAFVAGLFIGGAQPVAVGLFPAPWDKLAHIVAFGTLTVLLEFALRPRAWLLMALPMLVSALDEFHQIYLPGRSAEFADWLAGAIGVVIAFLLLRRTRLRALVTLLRG